MTELTRVLFVDQGSLGESSHLDGNNVQTVVLTRRLRRETWVI